MREAKCPRELASSGGVTPEVSPMRDESSTPTKVCSRCGVKKSATREFFGFHPGCRDGLRCICNRCRVKVERVRSASRPEVTKEKRAARYDSQREKAKQAARDFYADNAEHCKEVQRIGHYRRKYGCTPEFKEQLLDAQGGVCAICGKVATGRWHLDHEHGTGRIRGVLCSRCNQGLGLFGDDPKVCAFAADYLSNPARIV